MKCVGCLGWGRRTLRCPHCLFIGGQWTGPYPDEPRGLDVACFPQESQTLRVAFGCCEGTRSLEKCTTFSRRRIRESTRKGEGSEGDVGRAESACTTCFRLYSKYGTRVAVVVEFSVSWGITENWVVCFVVAAAAGGAAMIVEI